MTEFIRNFCIIAHIDHGKSTLADRFLEITETIDFRKVKEQYLDQLELERERGITIKMAPVRMLYRPKNLPAADRNFILNLIDTPGHADFSYEVSRALAAVEGAILLVDASQGIQAQTLANYRSAQKAGLVVIGAVNKIDLISGDSDRLRRIVFDLADLINGKEEEIHLISAKKGTGVAELLSAVIEKVPPPRLLSDSAGVNRALVFDSFYDNHKGVVAGVRVFDGQFNAGSQAMLMAVKTSFKIKELGFFVPEVKPQKTLQTGEIGYIATGLKDPAKVRIGDTLTVADDQRFTARPLPGYQEPQPVVFVSFYPENGDDYENLKYALDKLRLNDSALNIKPDRNEILGRGFKLGFLGKLHYEITAARLQTEFGLETIHTFPSVVYQIRVKNQWREITRPEEAPADFEAIKERMAHIEVILPTESLNKFLAVSHEFRIGGITVKNSGKNALIEAEMPLAELLSDFDDQLKSLSGGYGSFSYNLGEFKLADIVKVDILISGQIVPGMSRFLPKQRYEREARKMVERLKGLLPRQQYVQAIQAKALGRIIARENIPALKKDVTGYLYGGDRTRKMKLWQKQKRGKKKLKQLNQAKINPEVFKELLKK